MVAQKRGRGAKAQAAKAKAAAAAQVEEQVPDTEVNEGAGADEAEDNGLDQEMAEVAGEEGSQEEGGDDNAEAAADGEAKPEDKKEEKVESGKILVENLPASCVFDYQDKLKELFSKHGEVTNVKRGPIIVTELTTTPTLSAIVEFKNKDDLEKALAENGTLIDGKPMSVTVEVRSESAVLVGVPFEASKEYVRLLFSECGEIAQIHEFIKMKYKLFRVTFVEKDSVAKALKLDRELRVNGFLITVSQYRDDDDDSKDNKQNNYKRAHPSSQNRNANQNNSNSPQQRNNNFRGGRGAGNFNNRGNFRGGPGGRGRGAFPARGGAFPPRGGFAGNINNYMPPAPYMQRPGGFMNDGQRPNKRLRQM